MIASGSKTRMEQIVDADLGYLNRRELHQGPHSSWPGVCEVSARGKSIGSPSCRHSWRTTRAWTATTG